VCFEEVVSAGRLRVLYRRPRLAAVIAVRRNGNHGDDSDIGISVMYISPMLSMALPTVAILAHKRLSLATRQGSQSGAIQCVVALATWSLFSSVQVGLMT
jgi:hypothetical protein